MEGSIVIIMERITIRLKGRDVLVLKNRKYEMIKLILFIVITFVVLVVWSMSCSPSVKPGEEWRRSLNGVLMKEGTSENEEDMYAYQKKVPGVDFEEVVINCMDGEICIGKKWYRRRYGLWEVYRFRDSESIWYERLDKWGYTPEEGVSYCKLGCRNTGRTWEQEKIG